MIAQNNGYRGLFHFPADMELTITINEGGKMSGATEPREDEEGNGGDESGLIPSFLPAC